MTKKIKSDIPNRIIALLNQKPNLRFKEFKYILNVSSPSLSIHLKELVKENIIIFEKKGREKFYTLNKKQKKDSDLMIQIFSGNHVNQIEKLLKFGSYNKKSYYENEYYIDDEGDDEREGYLIDDDEESPADYYKKLVNMIGVYFLFTLFKGLETGNNWFKGFDKNNIAFWILDGLGKNLFEHFENSDLPNHLMNRDFDKFFRDVNLYIDKDGKEKIKTYFENIKYMYEYDYNALEESLREDYKHKVSL